MAAPAVTWIADGTYRVEHDGRSRIVYVAGAAGSLWAFADGRVYRSAGAARPGARRTGQAAGPQLLTAPMPATVLRVAVQAGAAVKKGDTVILLEAMKMELPLRAPADATVIAVHCREGEIVQPDATLVELS
jgi:biotin carboxyl carrier protein